MRTAPTAPAEPAAAEPLLPAADPAAPAPEVTELRATEQARLDDAATIADPDAPPETPPAERRPNRHDEQMAGIVAKRREKIAAERAEGAAQGFPDQEPIPQQEPGAPAPPVQEPPPDPAAAQPDPASAAAAPAAAPAAPVRTHKILVRGNEILMSDDDMRRAAELGVESEARIRHANATLEEARRIAGSPPQPIPGAGPSSPAAPPQPQTREPSETDRNAALELARELLYGDEGKVVDALLQWRQPSQQPTQPADPEALARDVYSRVDARLGLQHALQTFGSEYPEIINDPDLATLGANYVQQLRAHYAQTQTPRTELDLFREAGDAVRQAVTRWSGGGAPAPDPTPAPPPAAQAAGPSRITIKRSMPQAPAAAAAQQMAPAPRQKTGTDIVNEMRRARGQPVYA